jgi:S-adenosylmethionine hydrolase
VSRRVRCYADLPPGEPGWYAGSLGLIEIAVANDSAAVRCGVGRGAPVAVS